MLNNSGPSQNDGFPFSAQFAQPLPNQLGAGQNVYAAHNGQKALGGGRMANMQTAAQQRQRINGPLTGAPIQLQQQHFAQGQYAPSNQQPPQQRNAGPQQVANPNAILGALGQLGRGNVPASTAAFPSLPQAQGANAPRPAGMNFGGQYGRGERVALESYLGQQQPQGALGMMAGQRGGLGQLDTAGRNGPAAINNLLHSVSQQQGKGLGINGQSVALGTSQPFNKMDMRSTFQPGMHLAHRLPGMVHQKPPDNANLPAGLGHAATNSNFQGDHETVFDTSDFPALGMNLNADPAASSALRNVQHIFGDSQYSGLGQLPSSPPKPTGARAPLDHSDFPALGGSQAAHNLPMQAAARVHAPAAHLAPGDTALQHADSKATSQPMKAADPTKDQFGLMGLLSVIRMTDPDVTTLALGLDLQTLGLNLNATDNLHRTFGSPWSDEGRPAQLAQQLPSCYLFPPQQLESKSMGRLTAMSLFFLFYARAGEEEQLLAAEELCKRGWHFHKTHQVWCSPVPGKVRQCVINGATGEQGLFKVFDVSTWSVQDREDLFVDWSQCEEAPWRDRPPAGGLSPPTQQQTDGLAKEKDLKMGGGTDGHASNMQRYT